MKKFAKCGFSELAEVNTWRYAQDREVLFLYRKLGKEQIYGTRSSSCYLLTHRNIMTANKLTTYRIEQLEEKVKKHNNLVERMVAVEQSTKSAHHRLDELFEEREGH